MGRGSVGRPGRGPGSKVWTFTVKPLKVRVPRVSGSNGFLPRGWGTRQSHRGPLANGRRPAAEFGRDWHDPVTAAPPVERPDTRSCPVTVAEAQFRDSPRTGGPTARPRAVAAAGARSCSG